MRFFEIENSDSNTSEETVYLLEPLNAVTNIFSDTDAILDSSAGSSKSNNLPCAPLVFEKNSTFINTVSTAQTSRNSENFFSPKF